MNDIKEIQRLLKNLLQCVEDSPVQKAKSIVLFDAIEVCLDKLNEKLYKKYIKND